MIFLTVGTQLPFDRLVRAVDEWAGTTPDRPEIFGQIAEPGPDGYRPSNFEWVRFLAPQQHSVRFSAASLVVSHAGMGSLITAMKERRRILVLPRRAGLGEHRNDHQAATTRRFRDRRGVFVADDEAELGVRLATLTRTVAADGGDGDALPPFASDSLIAAVRSVVLGRCNATS